MELKRRPLSAPILAYYFIQDQNQLQKQAEFKLMSTRPNRMNTLELVNIEKYPQKTNNVFV